MSGKLKTAILLLLVCALIAVAPLMLIKDSEFGGADVAEEAIMEIAPDYEPWADPVLEPPGGETESLLFCIQAALGAEYLATAWAASYKERNWNENWNSLMPESIEETIERDILDNAHN